MKHFFFILISGQIFVTLLNIAFIFWYNSSHNVYSNTVYEVVIVVMTISFVCAFVIVKNIFKANEDEIFLLKRLNSKLLNDNRRLRECKNNKSEV